jgi:hypothetical protein
MGTTEGGQRQAQTIREKYGDDYWKKLGAKGGSSPKYTKNKRPFHKDRSLAKRAGYIGGKARGRKTEAAA